VSLTHDNCPIRDFAGNTACRLLALFGQDFANHFLSQSPSWLDSIIFAVGPLGVPAAIIAAIRVGGPPFLKGAIGRAGESRDGIERDLMSSTSKEVCELWDGQKAVRLAAANPIIQELIYLDGELYNLEDAEGRVLLTKKDGKGKGFLTKKLKRSRLDPEIGLKNQDSTKRPFRQ
jgi:hypothetical protein